jgi:hypothetical protein
MFVASSGIGRIRWFVGRQRGLVAAAPMTESAGFRIAARGLTNVAADKHLSDAASPQWL